MERLWFNEDDDMVYGIKSAFENEEEFKKEANKIHVEQTGYGCILDNIGVDVFLSVNETLKGEYIYLLKYSGAEVQTLYYADSESLEGYDIAGEEGIYLLDDGTKINLKGEVIKS